MVSGKNFTRYNYSLKIILLSFFITASLFTFATPIQQSFAGEITWTIPSGITTLIFRDITSTSDTLDAIISLDKSNYNVGDIATITVTDFNANLNTTGIEFPLLTAEVVMSSVTSSVELTETGINTGVFIGTFTVTDEPSISYDQDPPDSPRMSVTFDMTTGGDVTFRDSTFTASECFGGNGFRPVTHAVEIEYSNGAVQSGTDLDVTMSYANGAFDSGGFDIKVQTDMFYDSTGSSPSTASLIRQGTVNTGGSVNNVLKHIFDDPGNAAFGGTITEGIFYLGYDAIGCGGGGGGGFVRAGLVVNALAGLGAAGGGGGTPGPTIYLGVVAKYDSASETISLPPEIRDAANNHDPYTPLEPIDDIYEDFDFPLSINGNGFALGGYENTLETQTIESGEPTEFNIVYYTTDGLAHSSLYFNLGPTRTISGSDTQVLLYKDKPIEIIDPNGNIASATGSLNNEDDLKRTASFSITFSDDIQWSKSDMVIRSWTDSLNSGDTIVYDAIEVTSSSQIVEVVEEDIPEPEIQTLKSQHVPIWIKNNAAWWSQELIDDSDFVAGIEYLIQQEIITLTETGTLETNSSDEIPSWIKTNAGWWSEDLITEKEFIDGMQWLISNGIIKVVEI